MKVSRRMLIGGAVAAAASSAGAADQARRSYQPNPAPMPISLPRMTRGYANGPYGQVHYQDAGRGRPLVLIHQAPMSSRQFESVEERADFLDGVQLREIDFEYQTDGSHLVNAFASRSRMYREGGNLPDPRLMTRYTIERFVGYGPFWYGHHAAFIYDHNATIMKVRKPTLIITNTGDQIYEHARWAHRMRPDFAYVELQGGGVDIVDQQPLAWVQAIADFLDA